MPGLHDRFHDLASHVRRDGDHGDVDALALDETIELARVTNRNAGSGILSHLLPRRVEECHDVEAVTAEAADSRPARAEVSGAEITTLN